VSKENLRPTIPPSCPPELHALISMCWHKAKENRLTSNQLAEALKKLNDLYLANKTTWDALVVKK
jgi:hypothetical protein